MNQKITFILGGARSGKSSYAVKLAKKLSQKVVFIATATFSDEEMKRRIKLHQNSRPKHWRLIEEGKKIKAVLSNLEPKYNVILIDCLGLWISNLLLDNLDDQKIIKKVKEFLKIISNANFTIILVSNEVGTGIVPNNPLARRFQDLLGLTNQMVAKKADEVIFMQSGIPIKIKGE